MKKHQSGYDSSKSSRKDSRDSPNADNVGMVTKKALEESESRLDRLTKQINAIRSKYKEPKKQFDKMFQIYEDV